MTQSARLELESRAIEAIRSGTKWFSAAEIGRLAGAGALDPAAVVGAWLARGRIFGIDEIGATMFPAYLFDEAWQPLPAAASVLSTLAGYPPLRLASWFESVNPTLGGTRPRDVLASDPDAVMSAAKNQLVGAVHG